MKYECLKDFFAMLLCAPMAAWLWQGARDPRVVGLNHGASGCHAMCSRGSMVTAGSSGSKGRGFESWCVRLPFTGSHILYCRLRLCLQFVEGVE